MLLKKNKNRPQPAPHLRLHNLYTKAKSHKRVLDPTLGQIHLQKVNKTSQLREREHGKKKTKSVNDLI